MIGSTGFFDLLVGHEVVHVSMRQGDLILILLAKFLFLGQSGGGKFGERVSKTFNSTVGKRVMYPRGSEWVVVLPWL
jgi:hypothetical protein